MLYVTLPCKPVVKQYLLNHYGQNIQLPDGDLVKLLIQSMLQRKSHDQDSKVTYFRYTEEVKIQITYKVYELYGDQLSPTSIRVINNLIEKKIHARLYDFMEFFICVANYQQKDAIIMFQLTHGFTEEIFPFDTIKKYYQRNIQPHLEKTAIKFASVNVPSKNPYRFRKTG